MTCMCGQRTYLSETWVYWHLFRRCVSPVVTVPLWLSFRCRQQLQRGKEHQSQSQCVCVCVCVCVSLPYTFRAGVDNILHSVCSGLYTESCSCTLYGTRAGGLAQAALSPISMANETMPPKYLAQTMPIVLGSSVAQKPGPVCSRSAATSVKTNGRANANR
eukprot:COSAG03_NODE_680_length_6345_cov_66.753122_10_plen_161_part_00